MKLFLALLALFALSFGVYIYADIATQPASVISTIIPEKMASTSVVTIVRTKSGYEPSEVVVSKGTTVLWKNDSGSFHWPASDPYPSHSEYPSFDAKRPLAPGEEWQFTFDRPGEWGFHDHIKAIVTGTIHVEDPDAEAFELEEGQIVE